MYKKSRSEMCYPYKIIQFLILDSFLITPAPSVLHWPQFLLATLSNPQEKAWRLSSVAKMNVLVPVATTSY